MSSKPRKYRVLELVPGESLASKPSELIQIRGHDSLTLNARRAITILWHHAHRQGIEPGRTYQIELDALVPFNIALLPRKSGKKVTHLQLNWWPKSPEERKAAYQELQRPRVGRRAGSQSMTTTRFCRDSVVARTIADVVFPAPPFEDANVITGIEASSFPEFTLQRSPVPCPEKSHHTDPTRTIQKHSFCFGLLPRNFHI